MPYHRLRRWIRNIVLFLLLVFGCPGSMAVVGDIACNISINTWLPVYPDAQVISVEHNFIRPRGLGATLMVLRTPDDPETVNTFYRQNIQDLVDRGAPRGMGSTDWSAREDPDEEGTLLALYSRCIA
ncbi:MAG: hypothetical protein K8J31_30860 [Anaerolineae bacterium]|nr:hypothetical protein [Anaerolineae bacterium]